MIRTRKLKIIVIILTVLSVSVLPMAFGVSYAKWTGGSGSISATVTVGGGGENPDEPDNPAVFPGANPQGGFVIYDPATGQSKILENGSFSMGSGGEGYICCPDGDASKPVYIQIYAVFGYVRDENGNEAPDTRGVNFDLFVGGGAAEDVEHISGSYWYVLPSAGRYIISVDVYNELVTVYHADN